MPALSAPVASASAARSSRREPPRLRTRQTRRRSPPSDAHAARPPTQRSVATDRCAGDRDGKPRGQVTPSRPPAAVVPSSATLHLRTLADRVGGHDADEYPQRTHGFHASPLVPVLAHRALARESMDLALVVFLAGMAPTDGARWSHRQDPWAHHGDFGKLMDPIADKLFVGTAFVSLAALGMLEVAIVAIHPPPVEVRRVSGLRWVAKGRGCCHRGQRLGKAKTGVFRSLTVSTLIYIAGSHNLGCRASRRAP